MIAICILVAQFVLAMGLLILVVYTKMKLLGAVTLFSVYLVLVVAFTFLGLALTIEEEP